MPSLPTRLRATQRWSLLILLAALISPLAAAEQALLVPVPEGVHQVRVEVLDPATGEWRPYSIAHHDGRAGTLKLRVPEGVPAERLRVSTREHTALPERITQDRTVPAPRLDLTTNSTPLWSYTQGGAFTGDSSLESGRLASPVQESDIWQLQGEQLFYYNPLRGLQAFAVGQDDTLARLGSLRLPRYSGGVLYPLAGGRVALLGLTYAEAMPKIEVSVAEAAPGLRLVAAPLSFDGYLLDSRLVGTRLHVVTQDSAQYSWQYARQVRLHTVDLANPAQPRVLESVDVAVLAGWQSTVQATEDGLIIALQGYGNEPGAPVQGTRPFTRLLCFNYRAADGVPELAGEAEVAGFVNDKFKLDCTADTVTAVSALQTWTPSGPTSRVSTFARSAHGLTPLDTLDLAPGETLFATRFDGDRLYVVTFLRKDPLFVIDLSQPADLKVLGQLDVPGWSTHLEPLGEHLLSIGIEGSQVAISLFDVGDATQPSLLQRLKLGGDQSSWSIGNYDEKAVKYFADRGLLLVPFQTWGSNGYYSRGVQVIEVAGETLTARGVLPFDDAPQRATLLGDRLLALATNELRLADLTNPDAPVLLDQLALSWAVDRVVPLPEALVQISPANTGYGFYAWSVLQDTASVQPTARLYFTARTALDVPLAVLDLPLGSVNGATLIGNHLHLIQLRSEYPAVPEGSQPPKTQGLYLVVDVANPRAPKIVGRCDLPALTGDRQNTALRAEVRPDGRVLWLSEPGFMMAYGIGLRCVSFTGDIAFAFSGASLMGLYQFNFGTGLLAYGVDAQDPTAPQVLSAVDAEAGSPNWFSVGDRAFASRNLRVWETIGDTSRLWEQDELLVLDTGDLAQLRLREPVPFIGSVIGAEAGPEGTVVLQTLESETIYQLEDLDQGQDGLIRTYVSAKSYRTHRALVWDDVQALVVDTLEQNRDWSGFNLNHQGVIYSEAPTVRSGDQDYGAVDRLVWDLDAGYSALDPLRFPGEAMNAVLRDDRLWLQTPSWIGNYQLAGRTATADRAWVSTGLYLGDFKRTEREGDVLWAPLGAYGVEGLTEEASMLPPEFSEPPPSTIPPPPPTTVPPPPPSFLPASATLPVWTILPADAWSLTELTAADRVGRVDRSRWAFVPTAGAPLDPAAVDSGEGWRRSAWLGHFYQPMGEAWVWSLEQGWLCGLPDPSGAWCYDAELGWVWTGAAVPDWWYSPARGAWLRYLQGTGSQGTRWFYDTAAAQWFGVPRL